MYVVPDAEEMRDSQEVNGEKEENVKETTKRAGETEYPTGRTLSCENNITNTACPAIQTNPEMKNRQELCKHSCQEGKNNSINK